MAVRLFVGNLPYDMTEAELRAHFAAVGPLSSLSRPTHRDTGRPRGFAFIAFSDRADAEEAICRLNHQAFKGRSLAVSEARARDDRSTPSRPCPAAPRPSFAAEPSADASRRRAQRKPSADRGGPCASETPDPFASAPKTTGTMMRGAMNTLRVDEKRLSIKTPSSD